MKKTQWWILVLVGLLQVASAQTPDAARWSPERANAWYAKQPWLVGANFIPSDAINQLEMFQAATFNPALIDHELGLAESIGMNTMRVFLQDQLWQQDPKGFLSRLDTFLAIASRHGIRPMFVLFDSCWESDPKLGPQHPPIPGIHNSGWVQSPGARELADPAFEPILEGYVKGVVGAFANDPRVLAWDIWNEPENRNGKERKDKVEHVDHLLPLAFAWARTQHPIQPLTSAPWTGNDWSHPEPEEKTLQIQLAESDILTFHNYGFPEAFEARIRQLQPYGRPILCSEYMARSVGSTFDGDLPIAKQFNVGVINWGLVAGRTQTWLPWDSWQHPYIDSQPSIWFHEVFRPDGTPYRQHEVDQIRRLTGRGTPAISNPAP